MPGVNVRDGSRVRVNVTYGPRVIRFPRQKKIKQEQHRSRVLKEWKNQSNTKIN